MDRKKQSARTQMMFFLSALLIIGVVVGLLIHSAHSGNRDTIVMPDTAVPVPQQPEKLHEDPPELLEVTRENVLQVVRSLSRPASYHQSCRIVTGSGETRYEYTAEVWVSESLVRADLSSRFETKSLLTDGETLYIWYDGEMPVRTLPSSQTLTMDDLIGIASYEDILRLPETSILEGSFLTDERFPVSQQVYIAAEQDEVRQEYWVGLDYGLLSAFIMRSGGETVYEMTQTGLDVLASADEAFGNVFVLPDGSVPFKEAEMP